MSRPEKSTTTPAGGGVGYEEISVEPLGSEIVGESAVDPNTEVEIIHDGGTGSAQFCTVTEITDPCSGGTFTLTPGQSYSGPFSGLNITGGPMVKVTNTGNDTLLIRVRVVE